MISKELLSEVLDIKDIVHTQKEGRNDLFISRRDNPAMIINIYELAFKCKEWAFKQGYSYLGNKGLINIYSKTGTVVAITDKNVVNWFDVYIDFKACEWILKELKK